MRVKQKLWVIYRIPMTSYNWGNRSKNPQHKLFRAVDGNIPCFSTRELAVRYCAGAYRPNEDTILRSKGGRGIKRNTVLGLVERHNDYSVEVREIALTKRHIIDPPPPQEPMTIAEFEAKREARHAD